MAYFEGINEIFGYVISKEIYNERFYPDSLEEVDIFGYLHRYLKYAGYDYIVSFKKSDSVIGPFASDEMSATCFGNLFKLEGPQKKGFIPVNGAKIILTDRDKLSSYIKMLRYIDRFMFGEEQRNFSTAVILSGEDLFDIIKNSLDKTDEIIRLCATLSNFRANNKIRKNIIFIFPDIDYVDNMTTVNGQIREEWKAVHELFKELSFWEACSEGGFRKNYDNKSHIESINGRFIEVEKFSTDEVKNMLIKADIEGEISLDYNLLDDISSQLVAVNRYTPSQSDDIKSQKPQIVSSLEKSGINFDKTVTLSGLKNSICYSDRKISYFDELQNCVKEISEDPLEKIRNMQGNGFKTLLRELTDIKTAYDGTETSKATSHVCPSYLAVQRIFPADSKNAPAFLNFVLVGPPGSGKTTVARLLGEALRNLGILPSGHLVETSVGQLKQGFVGQTAVEMKNKVKDAIGGVLFIDEAHNLRVHDNNGNEEHFKQEIMEVLIPALTNYKGRMAVVLAGYEDRMEKIWENDEGLSSRFRQNFIRLDTYSELELFEIARSYLKKNNVRYTRGYTDDNLRDFLTNWYIDRLGDTKRAWANVRTLEEEFLVPCIRANTFSSKGTSLEKYDKEYHLITSDELEDIMSEFVGMENVKEIIRTMHKRITKVASLPGNTKDGRITQKGILEIRRRIKLKNYSLLGNPGTGKSEFARLMGRIFREFRILTTGAFIQKRFSDINTPEKMEEAFSEANGSVLLIDETAGLDQQIRSDANCRNAVNNLCSYITDGEKNNICVIFTGYEKDWAAVKSAQEGLESRFTEIRINDYDINTLYEIFTHKLREHINREVIVTEEAKKAVIRIIAYKKATGTSFGNGRYVSALAKDLWPFMEDETLDIDAVECLEDYKFIKDISIADVSDMYSRDFSSHEFIASFSADGENALDENDNITGGFLTKMENAIVRIEAKKGGDVHSHSTGYIIGGKYVATCHHCVDGADSFSATLKIKQGSMNFEKNISLSVVASSKEGDCAILAIKDSFESGSVYPSLYLAPEGTLCSLQDKVFSAGYPLGIRDLQLHTPSKVVGTNSGYILFEGQAIHQGDSGAPIINTDGLVIGYLCGSINHSSSGVHAPSETNRFAHIDYLYRLMKNIKNKENN